MEKDNYFATEEDMARAREEVEEYELKNFGPRSAGCRFVGRLYSNPRSKGLLKKLPKK